MFICRECMKSLTHREIMELKNMCSTCALKEATEHMKKVTSDPWTHHLQKHHLVALSRQAQAIGYRIRAASDWSFDLEYEGEQGHLQGDLKTFTTDEQGKQAARTYLHMRKSERDQGKKTKPSLLKNRHHGDFPRPLAGLD